MSVRLQCCTTDWPEHVFSTRTGHAVSITAPIHLCRRSPLDATFDTIWDSKTGPARASGVVESVRPRPPTWVLLLNDDVEPIEIEERYPDDSPGTLDIGTARLPAQIVDRSFHGVGCVVPALVHLRPGQRVRVVVGVDHRAGVIACVRPLGNQLRVGVRLDPP